LNESKGRVRAVHIEKMEAFEGHDVILLIKSATGTSNNTFGAT